ncbi:calcium-translocating P-type ATPase [Ceratocystis lukuohia]|uniref:Calcium-transporting ATPase n=1 Tax=Ceratocystis lukuohia TaxID=2019550 RepID=A0ABR4MP93_9PEZI
MADAATADSNADASPKPHAPAPASAGNKVCCCNCPLSSAETEVAHHAPGSEKSDSELQQQQVPLLDSQPQPPAQAQLVQSSRGQFALSHHTFHQRQEKQRPESVSPQQQPSHTPGPSTKGSAITDCTSASKYIHQSPSISGTAAICGGELHSDLSKPHDHSLLLSAIDNAAFPDPANHHFAFSPAQLRLLTSTRSIDALCAFGGISGLAAGLRTNTLTGLSMDEIQPEGRVDFSEAVASARDVRLPRVAGVELPEHSVAVDKALYAARQREYGSATAPQNAPLGRAFVGILWRRINDKLHLALFVSAIITLVLAACQTKNHPKKYKQELSEAAATVGALVVLILSRTFSEWEARRRFLQVDDANIERMVKVIRSASLQQIRLSELHVGDVVQLEPGEVIPADGIVISSDGLLIDEYSVRGEPRPVPKHMPPSKYGPPPNNESSHLDPFLISETVVLGGSGTYLVASTHKWWPQQPFGQYPPPETPLQTKLGVFARKLAAFGTMAGSLYLVILFIRYIIRVSSSSATSIHKARVFFDVLVNVSTVLIISIPSSLVFSALATLASTTSRMMTEGNLVKNLESIEIMGDVTCICTGKGGSLTHDDVSLTAGRAGYGKQYDFPEMFARNLGEEAKNLIKSAILLTSSGFETVGSTGCSEFAGSSVEMALLEFARDHLSLGNLLEERASFQVVRSCRFDSSSMLSFVLVHNKENERYRVYAIGAAEAILEHCGRVLDDPAHSLSSSPLTLDIFESLDASIHNYGRRMLSPVAVAYRDFLVSDFPIESLTTSCLLSDLVFVSLVGLQDPLRPDMTPLVRQCHQAGIFVRLVTGENFSLAREVATRCGIFTPGGIIMDGATFRTLSHWQLDLIVPRLQILARATPEDKLLLVAHLRSMGETVATTGSSLKETLSIKTADVGFAFGHCGAASVACQSASILALNQNFYSIVRALSWGRTVGDSVRKFLQFQLTLNITSGVVTVISTLVGTLIFNIPQLLWVNVIGTVIGLVALTTDYPSDDFLRRRPHLRPQALITLTMWKMILCQALYQILSILTIHYIGWAIFEPNDDDEISDLQTLVFNIYVMMQLFNLHNCRRVDNKINVHHQGFFRSPWFLIAQGIIIVGQVIIVTFGDKAFNTNPLDLYQWAWSILFGFLTLPLGVLIRKIPDTLIYCVFQIFIRTYRSMTQPLIALMPTRCRADTHKAGGPPKCRCIQWLLKAGESILTPITYFPCKHIDAAKQPITSTRSGLMAAPLWRARHHLQNRLLEQSKTRGLLNLSELVESSRTSLNPIESGLDIHPETGLNDPVLMKTIGVDGASDPPSQDPEIIKMLSLRSKR